MDIEPLSARWPYKTINKREFSIVDILLPNHPPVCMADEELKTPVLRVSENRAESASHEANSYNIYPHRETDSLFLANGTGRSIYRRFVNTMKSDGTFQFYNFAVNRAGFHHISTLTSGNKSIDIA